MWDRVSALYEQASRGDRILVWAVAIALLGILIARPVLRTLDPRSARAEDCAEILFAGGGLPKANAVDPWGKPFEYHYNGDSSASFYRSFGPNGVDEAGAGDDVDVWGRGMGGFSLPLMWGFTSPGHAVLRALLGLLCGVLVGGRLYLWALRREPSRDDLLMEAVCSVVLAVPLGAAVTPFALFASQLVLEDQEALDEVLITPLPLALAGVSYGLCTLGVLQFRLRRAEQTAEGAEPSS